MKKILNLLLLLAFSASCVSQEQPKVRTKTKQDYLYKSHRQNNTGFIMLGVGVAAMLGGAVIAASSADYSDMWGLPAPASSNDGADAGAVLFIAGGASAVGSIFMFVAAGNNRRKANAMTASFKMEKGVPSMLRDMGPTYYPAISLKFNLK
jgi:hypothetical protein